MRRSASILCMAIILGGASAWGDAPPISSPLPPPSHPVPGRHKSVQPGSAANGEHGDAPRAPTAALPAPTEPPSNLAGPRPEEASGSDGADGEDASPAQREASEVILDFRIRELMELKRIARELGGNLIISIEPRGIAPADLIVPLKNSGLFEVSAKDGKTFLVTSNGEGQKHEMEREIAALARRQAALLRNIEVLEAMRAEGKVADPSESRGPGAQRSVAERENSAPAAPPPDAGASEYPLPKK